MSLGSFGMTGVRGGGDWGTEAGQSKRKRGRIQMPLEAFSTLRVREGGDRGTEADWS